VKTFVMCVMVLCIVMVAGTAFAHIGGHRAVCTTCGPAACAPAACAACAPVAAPVCAPAACAPAACVPACKCRPHLFHRHKCC
jgi:hypothetical protein